MELKRRNKNIIICLDGTGNRFKEENTNIVKLYRVLHRDPQEQVVYYDPGVGTLGDPTFKIPVLKKINKLLGLAFGKGLIKNIEEAYSFLIDHYEDGDEIFIFGFSRGAYTARALAGLIHCCGILEKGCQNLIPYAIKLFRVKEEKDFATIAKFKSTYGRSSEIAFLGLWDTVSTLGWIYDPIFLPFTSNNKSVRVVRHALAIDEKRAFFSQVHWGKKYSLDVKEVWFAGVHSDIGGGYTENESGLSKISLEWMIKEIQSLDLGVKIDPKKYDRYVLGKNTKDYIGPDHNAKKHKSLKGGWWLVQFFPLKVWDEKKGKKVLSFPKKMRNIQDGSVLHKSVFSRILNKDSNYRPKSLKLSDDYDLNKIEETLENFKKEV